MADYDRDVIASVRLTNAGKNHLVELANEAGCSVSDAIRVALQMAIESSTTFRERLSNLNAKF